MRIKIENGPEVDGARLLMELHNHTRSFGMGSLHDRGRISLDDAKRTLDDLSAGDSEYNDLGLGGKRIGHVFSFDYFRGRPLKVRADDDGIIHEHSRRLFDRDAGEGQFDRAVQAAVDGERTEAAE